MKSKAISGPAVSRQSIRVQEKRTQILDAAKDLFEEKGFQATTTAEIARKAEVAEGTLFDYFKTKKDLLYALVERDMKAYIDFIELHLRGIEGAINKIRKIIWSHLYTFREKRFVARFLILEIRQDPHYYQSKAYEVVRRYGRLLLEIIQEGIERGEIRADVNPHMVRDMILGTIEHVALPWAAQEKPYDVDASVRELCDLVFRAIKP